MKRKVVASVCVVAGFLFTASVVGCRRSASPAPAAGAKVARIVFVDKQNACKCTRDRTEASWEALQIALGKGSRIPIERIHIDTQTDKVAPYQKLRPVMAIPAVYMMDGQGRLVAMFQGELKPEQLAQPLEKK